MLEQAPAPLDCWQDHDIDYGRYTQWYIVVYNTLDHPKTEQWPELRRFIHIHRVCYDTQKKTTTHSDRYYII